MRLRLDSYPVVDEIASRLELSMQVAIMATIMATVIAIPLGTVAALFKDTWIDQIIRVFAIAGLAIPSFWLGMLAFGINTGFVSAVFVEAVVGFGVAIPAAPGFVGTFHAAAKFALSDVYGVAEPDALAFAFGYHFGGWIPITVIGLWYAWRLGLSISDMGAAEEQLERGVEVAHEAGPLSKERG